MWWKSLETQVGADMQMTWSRWAGPLRLDHLMFLAVYALALLAAVDPEHALRALKASRLDPSHGGLERARQLQDELAERNKKIRQRAFELKEQYPQRFRSKRALAARLASEFNLSPETIRRLL